MNFVHPLPPGKERRELPASESAAQMAGKQVINLFHKLVTYFRPDSLSEGFLAAAKYHGQKTVFLHGQPFWFS